MLNDSMLLSDIKEQNFDLMIVDSTPIAAMLVLIPYKFNVPFILCGAYYDPLALRVPFSPAVTPFEILENTDRMTFYQRFSSAMWHLHITYYSPFSYANAAGRYVPEKPNLCIVDIIKKTELVLYEYSILLKYPQPTMPNIVLLGDVTPSSDTQIPNNFKKFLDRSKNGVVLVSFGSLASAGDKPVFKKLVSAFKRTKYNYIIKGEFTQSDDQILAENWIPQSSLLKHANIKLFITHCGANGIREAIIGGVPMLGFPLFAEQPGNAFKMQSRGFGIKMDLYWDNEDDIVKSINEIIENPQYKNTVKRASEFMNAQKGNATLEAVFWIETILKFGGEYLRSAGVDIPLYQYLLLDVIFVLICIIIVVILIMYLICKCICNRMCSKTKTKRE
ncbi:hypothetical protein LOTGIDRAFT_134668 [Lottia gigantea]|uniref:UDP-glucuronosyltransferase n=1 Tax=Lottia gigantea TaxID=225164 RepID=V3ZNH9_LOTGI|nr:hypothetical protein LOTGIDRAFT_134668 [Lottia gigantea]ESO82401.1 hypothetical protein LOTGIDRAFT_134668 [Lottia gigantea]